MIKWKLINESVEEDNKWLEEYLKYHPEALEKLLKWVKSKNPTMSSAEQERFAKNILKKKHREGKIDDDIEIRKRREEEEKKKREEEEERKRKEEEEEKRKMDGLSSDERRFVEEIDGYGKWKNGKLKDEDERWLYLKGQQVDQDEYTGSVLKFYKPVGFNDDGKVLLDEYCAYYKTHDYDSDGDYDDGREHEWTDIRVQYKVDSSKKVGSAIGEIKDGKVVLSNGDILSGWSARVTISWRVDDKWSDRPNYYVGRKSYYHGRKHW